MGKPGEAEPGSSSEQETVVGRKGGQRDSGPAPGSQRVPIGARARSDVETPDFSSLRGASETDSTFSDVVLAEEASRAVGFSVLAMAMLVLVGAQLPLLGGDPLRRAICAAAMVAMFVVSLWAFLRARKPGGYTPAVYRSLGWTLATGMLAVELYCGFYSPVTVVLSLGIYYLGQSTDRLHALLVPLYVTVGWLTGGSLVMLGVVDDLGLYKTRGLDFRTHVLMLTGVGCSLLMTLWMARRARASLRRAIVESNRALLTAQKRGALLAEAHNQLERAMRAAVGKPGLYTNQNAAGYVIGNVIGVGAMGEVYGARGETDDRPAAVKLLHADTLRREDMVLRFLREAEFCKRFDHPNLVRVYAAGRMDDGAPFMVMERLQGKSLSSTLRERGQLTLEECIMLASALGSGLAHAHKRGVVHRDLKPHNIVEARSDDTGWRWTILDFGISKLMDSHDTLTGGGLLGTPAYMSPEQALGQVVDQRSDIFAMGSILYRCLTGRPAFPGKETARIMFDVAYAMPEQPSRQTSRVHPDVDLALAVAMAKRPDERFADPIEFARALRSAVKGSLDPSLRERGRSLVDERPWGSRPTTPPPAG